jgi:tetratricopeptide (TPR) repeat protein
MTAQSRGRYAEALQNYYEALQVEEDPYDRSYTLYNIGLIYGTGKYTQALEFYHQALSLNPNLPQALNNIAVIYHCKLYVHKVLKKMNILNYPKNYSIKLPNIGFKLLN